MRLSTVTFLLLGASLVLPSAVQGSLTCDGTSSLTSAGALSYWSLYDDADTHLPDLPIDRKCRLAPLPSATSTATRVFRWYNFRAPGNSSVTFDMVAQDKSADHAALAIYVGESCDSLACEQTATEGTSGTTTWTAVGGTVYRILATRIKEDADAFTGSIHRFEIQGATPMTVCELDLANQPSSNHKRECSCKTNFDSYKNASMECADKCANCHEEDDGTSFCYYPSVEQYYSDDATIGATGGKLCFTLADGFDADVVATTVCRDVQELEESGNSDCTFSVETGTGAESTCAFCSYNPSASCGSEADVAGAFPFADCGDGNIFSPCGNVGLTGVYADYERIIMTAVDGGGVADVGECLGEGIDAADALTAIDMEMDVFTDNITLQGGERQLYRLPVNNTIHRNVLCNFFGETGDPDFRIRSNTPDGSTKCARTQGGSTPEARQGDCSVTIYDGETVLYLEVNAFGTRTVENVWVHCTPYDQNLYMGDTTTFDIAADQTKWLRLDVEGRNQTIGCTLEGGDGDPDMALHL
ncbi:expressed unknown protein (Partial), partial [Seminavis robusta]|eukprot:Sro1839_g300930.1 n/a (528) ;mRNA; f:20113-21696